MTLRVRIALAGLGAVGLVLLATGWALSASLERDGRDEVDRELARRAGEVGPVQELSVAGGPGGKGVVGAATAPLDTLPGAPAPGTVTTSAKLLEGAGVFTLVRSPDGSGKLAGDIPDGAQDLPTTPGYATRRLAGASWRVLAATSPDGTVAILGQSLEPVLARVRTTRELLLRLGLLALAVTGLTGFGIGSVALRPLQRLRREAETIGVGDATDARLTAGGPPEVAALGGALDRMLARLRDSAGQTERALESTRRFAGDAGHELRTPLAGMAADLGVLQDRSMALPADARDAVAALAGQHVRLTALLDALQTLALGDARTALHFATVDLADVAEQAVASARRRHPQRAVALHLGVAHAPVHGWADGLHAVADNLVENALRHGGPGARVRVGVQAAEGGAALSVDDDGPGVPPAEHEHIFARFGRGRGAWPGGSGLGLSIVAQQAELHGGSVQVGTSPSGGARFVVVLPLATPPARRRP
ncbi:MAG: two-component system, OmpR family, sensor histidine kinase PrrB [Solirubrobacteraceae bacterium]|nr:two-component system, OmpR family, sensor histidine kinase PrrB [Solirubrobacteraceae bacterium]